jgi:colanic acid biosynthesis glycosyl transferase WcaI
MRFRRTRQNRRQKLWILCELYSPELTSTGYYATAIAEHLAQFGSVFVLCGQPNYASRGNHAPKGESLNGVEVRRCSGSTFDKNRLLGRLLNMATLTVSIFARLLIGLRGSDRVLVLTNPPLIPYAAWLACTLRRARLSSLIHDNYPEVLSATGIAASRTLVGLFTKVRNVLIRRSQYVIVVGRDMADLLEDSSGRTAIIVLPNWAELEHVRPLAKDKSSLRQFRDSFVIMNAGNIGYPNELETVLAAAELLRNDSDIQFIFLGEGAKKAWLVSQISSRNLTNVHLLPARPRTEQTDFLGCADLGLITLVAPMLGVSVPSRGYNLLAAGKPIVAVLAEQSELARLVAEEDVGWVVPPGESELLAQVIREAKGDRTRLKSMSKRARETAVTRCGAEQTLRSYQELFFPTLTDHPNEHRRRRSAWATRLTAAQEISR